MKFYNTAFEINKNYAAQLQKKIAVFERHTRSKKNVFITMITTYGTVTNEHKLNVVTNEVNMDDLFI